MPEEDDEALGQMLGDRLKDANEEEEAGEEGEADTEPTNVDDDAAPSTTTSGTAQDTLQESSEAAASTETPSERDLGEQQSEDEGTVRSRSPFPLYVTPGLKNDVQNRFEKFNAERTLNDQPQVEKHKHFMEGLLQAGLDHPDLEEYVLEEFEGE